MDNKLTRLLKNQRLREILIILLSYLSIMAQSNVLPTFQRYINGVPVPQGRKALRLREKYIIVLVFLTFGIVCFGAFFFLPDLRDRVSVSEMKKQLQNAGDDIFFPAGKDDIHLQGKKHGDDVDIHKIQDKVALHGKIEQDWQREKVLEALGKKEGLKKDDTLKFQAAIKDDKEKVIQQKKEEEIVKKAEEEKKAVEEVHMEHSGGTGTRGGEPKDPEVKKKRDKIREVSIAVVY